VVLDKSADDARVVSRLTNPVLGLPCSAVVQSRLSTLRFSQNSHSLMEGLAKKVGLTYPDIITMVENKFTRVDRKVYQVLNIVSENELRKPVAQIQEVPVSPQSIFDPADEPILRAQEEGLVEEGQEAGETSVSDPELEAEVVRAAQEEASRVEETFEETAPEPHDPCLEVSNSHETKYEILLDKLDALISETRVVQFLEKFTDLNDFLNAYISQLDSQLVQVRKVRSMDLLGSRNLSVVASGDA